MTREQIIADLAQWIDQTVIAECLVDGMEANDIEPTLDRGKKLWEDILQNELNEAIQSTIKYAPAFN